MGHLGTSTVLLIWGLWWTHKVAARWAQSGPRRPYVATAWYRADLPGRAALAEPIVLLTALAYVTFNELLLNNYSKDFGIKPMFENGRFASENITRCE
jgi:hypothetical protein